MPWDPIRLNDGHFIPSIVFGTENLGNGQKPIDQVEQALSVGFGHIETAQGFQNEAEAGIAIRESGLARYDICITTKFSGLNGLDVPTSMKNSLHNLGVTYVDLYLIHHPSLAIPDMATVWKEMEELKRKGLTKSIGVCNFGVPELKILLASAKIKPAVNQMELHPYVFARQKATMEYATKHGIVTEAFSTLTPVTRRRGGSLDKPLSEIATRLAATSDQVLLAWAKAKGAVVITSSSKRWRLEGYLCAADLPLTPGDIFDLDEAGASSKIVDFLPSLEPARVIVVILLGMVLLALSLSTGCSVLDML